MLYGDPLVGPNGKPLCGATFAEHLAKELNPFGTDTTDQIEMQSDATLKGLKIYYYGRATTYAGGRLLSTPLRSKVVQGLLEKSEAAGEWAEPVAMGFVDYKIWRAGVLENVDTRIEGGCYAEFRSPSAQ